MTEDRLKTNDLPSEAHVVRYVKRTGIFEDGSVDGSEFRLGVSA